MCILSRCRRKRGIKMTLGSFFTLFILWCLIPVTIQQNCCPENYSLHVVSDTQAICIRRITTPMSFDNARANCETTQGASLLKLYPYQDVQAVVDTNSVHWIGLRRDPNDNNFRWTFDGTRTRITLVNWGQSEPANNFDCVRVNTDLTWAAVSCTNTLNYICQVDVNCAVSSCLSTIGEARCPCEAGFVMIGQQCQDINECDEFSSPCGNTDSNVQCANTDGSYNCQCNDGFSRETANSLCTANQECTVHSDCTGNNQECRTSYDGVLRCQCVFGYTGATCDDVNECNCTPESAECISVCENEQCEMRRCAGDNEVCANTPGTFTCNCASGFVRTDRNFCIDVDECAEGICSGSRQTCTNTLGSFLCVCDVGYELNNLVCVESCSGRCNAETEDCLPADFSCVCKNGFFSRDGGNCQDINECGSPTACTMDNMICDNTPGSFVCMCTEGFGLTDDQCVDINECDEGTHTCQSTADCVNTQGSFMCTCRENEMFENGECIALSSFRVRIIATELNNTIPSDPATSRTLFEAHFCKVIRNILEREFPGIPEDCSVLRFDDAVTGYLQVRMASTSLTASVIESRLEGNVVTDVSGDLRIRSDDTLTTITIADRASGIDVVDFATTPCDPSPCQNNAPCVADLVVRESQCLCSSSFSGEFCQTGVVGIVTQQPTTAVTGNSTNNGLVIGIIVAIIGILLFALLCCVCVCCYFLANRPNTFGAPRYAPGYGGPTVAGPGVAPIKGPPSVSGFGRGGYYEANSVI